MRMEGNGSLVDQAVHRVRDYIRANNLKVGDSLPGEGHFAAELSVSRAVMREAFGALAALRLIDVANGRRARVGKIDGGVMAASLDHAVATEQVSMAQIWDVRRTLEMRTAELAAQHRTDAQAERIVAFAEAMRTDAADGDKRTAHDIALHRAIAEASGNALFIQIVRSFEGLMEAAVPAAWKTRTTEDQREAMLVHHLALAHAIRDRDAVKARDLMESHFATSIGDLFARMAA